MLRARARWSIEVVRRARERMKPALHRSTTFWFGILVMTFLVWGWWDSTQRGTWLVKSPWLLESFGSGISFERHSDLGVTGRSSEWRVDREEMKDYPDYYSELLKMRLGRPFFARPLDQGEQNEWLNAEGSRKYGRKEAELVQMAKSLRPDQDPMEIRYHMDSWSRGAPADWKLFFPYWIILPAFALPWTALLIWLAKRRRRITQAPE